MLVNQICPSILRKQEEYIVEYLSMKVNRLELNSIKLCKELKAVWLRASQQKPVFKQSDLTRLKKLQSSLTAELPT